jgi:hypothetical protein
LSLQLPISFQEVSIYDAHTSQLPDIRTFGISTVSLLSNSDISIILIDYATAILAKQFHVRHGMIPPSTIQYQYIPGAKVSDYNQYAFAIANAPQSEVAS